MENLLFYLQQTFPSMTETDRKIASFITAHPQEATTMKILELSKVTQTSPPAITRFCKKLGLPGFPELKMDIAKNVYKSENKELNLNLELTKDIDLQQAPEPSCVVKNVITTAIGSLSYLEKLIDPKAIHDAVEMLRTAHRILIAGIGASGVVALDLYQKLLRLGLLVEYNSETHLQMVCASTLSKGDVAFVISYSGETPEVIATARRAKSNGASLLAVTRIGNTSLHRLADLSLLIPDTENICRNGAFISRLDQMLINDMLFYTFLSQHYEEYQKEIDSTWEGVSSISSKIHNQGKNDQNR